MHNHGFLRVAAAVPALKLADCRVNAERHLELLKQAEARGVRLVVFPECSLTGYTCGDLFHQETLLRAAEDSLKQFVQDSDEIYNGVSIVGLPIRCQSRVFNCAAIIQGGAIHGLVPKSFLPNYREFYDARYFAPASQLNLRDDWFWYAGDTTKFSTHIFFALDQVGIGIEICEDLWMPNPPSSALAAAGAHILVNLSASNETIGKVAYRRQLVATQSARCIAGYIYSSSGPGESTSDLVFGGHSIIAENGVILAESQRFQRESHLSIADIDLQRLQHDRLLTNTFNENTASQSSSKPIQCIVVCSCDKDVPLPLERFIDPHPFVPSDPATLKERCEEIFNIQTTALARRLESANLPAVSIGISGGLDSTLALLVLCKTMDSLKMPRSKIRGFTLPGFGTTNRTKNNAWTLMKSLGVTGSEIDICTMAFEQMKALHHAPFGISLEKESVESFSEKLKYLSADLRNDLVFENVQARVRTSLLMNAGFVLGTGDLSELCLGWCTYNADHMSMYNVNVSIPKTLVKFLVKWAAENEFDGDVRRTLLDVVDTEISPELLPTSADGKAMQSTEAAIGPYELHDFFIYHMLRWGSPPEKILFLAKHAKFDVAYSESDVKKWLTLFLKRFFANQFKRSCLPDGPKVGSVSISPRGDWRMPSDASVAAWLEELE